MRYVALLRGIGPQNPNMRGERLRGVVAELGFSDVATVIGTGNIIFEAGAVDTGELESMLERAWPEQLGFASHTIVRSRDEIERLIDANPFGDTEDTKASSLQVTFFQRAPEIDFTLPHAPDPAYSIVWLGDRTMCSVVDTTGNAGTPDLMRWLEKRFGKAITTRTWKTVHRIRRKLD